MPNILDYFPGTPRPQQEQFLREFEKNYDSHDVFCGQMPTGVGKTKVAVTIMRWLKDRGVQSTTAVPNNVLLNQFLETAPELATLHRRSAYHCKDFGQSCEDTVQACGKPCMGCPYTEARKTLVEATSRVVNYYTYLAHKAYSEVVIFDEGHLTLEMLQNDHAIKIWKHLYNYPGGMWQLSDVVSWMDGLQDETLAKARKEILRLKHGGHVEYTSEMYRGKYRQVLKITPLTVRDNPPILWPRAVKKLVLLSATIGPQDVYELGLDKRRVKYIETDSPIPPANRPVFYDPAANVTHALRTKAIPLLAARINKLVEARPGEKGLIHLPYKMVEEIAPLLTSDRFLFHRRDNKVVVLAQFKESSPAEGRVLVASGLHEGVDLPYDAARFQVIGKVPFLSLADEAVKAKMQSDEKWYYWCAAKKILQATGRIVRAPDDYGATYILDSQFGRLYDLHPELFPSYWRNALTNLEGKE